MVRLEGLGALKEKSMTPSGIEHIWQWSEFFFEFPRFPHANHNSAIALYFIPLLPEVY
jgi:hypothetical protein